MPDVELRLLDAYDRQILTELGRNARLPTQTIANRIGLSRSAVSLRIDRMERESVISGYTLKKVLPTEATSPSILMIQRCDRMRGADVISYLRRTPEISGCWVLSGELDIVAIVLAPTQDRLSAIWREVTRLSGVRDTITATALETVVPLK